MRAANNGAFDLLGYLFQAILTNRTDAPEEVWRFYRKHAEIETKIRELKWDYDIDGFAQNKRTVLRLSLAGPWRERFERALTVFLPARKTNRVSVAAG